MILVLGADGYLAAEYLSEYDGVGVDNFSKRRILETHNIKPLYTHDSRPMKVMDVKSIGPLIRELKPAAVIHLGEIASAPYSMEHPNYTIRNNLGGTLALIHAVKDFSPQTHIVKLGTLGQFGTPGVKIPEGLFDLTIEDRTTKALFPKSPYSWYHLSKVFDTEALMFASKLYGLRVTDLQQGFVYGSTNSRFCYDGVWGTVLNRFLVQAIAGHPLTVYGEGGQTRGMINIKDTVKCLNLAVENPPKEGEYKSINQLTEFMSVKQLANLVKEAGDEIGLKVKIESIPNPRVEKESHFYDLEYKTMKDYGLKPVLLTKSILQEQLELLMQYKQNIIIDQILPRVAWR